MTASLVFTADSTTDQLAHVAHGLNTGDGPCAVRNLGGGLPAPLAGITDYWAIRVDADHVKLATSSANAFANVWIDLTTNGTGTNTLELGIPYEQATTYAVGAQVKSADLNAIELALQAMHRLLTGQAQSIWTQTPKSYEKCLPITGGEVVNLTVATTGLTSTSGAWAFTAQMIDLPVGAKITSYRVVFTKTGTTLSNYKLIKYPSASVGTPSPAPVTVDSGTYNTSGYKDVTVAISSPVPIAAGERWHIALNAGDTGDVVLQLEVFYQL